MDADGEIAFEPAELDRRYQLRLELRDRDERWIAHFEQVLNPQSLPDAMGGTVCVPFGQPIDGLVVPRSGIYTLHVVVDRTRLASYPMEACHRHAA
jgi:hypothetical protein